MEELSVVGKRLPRVDAIEKATGEAKYTVDIKLPGMLYGKVLRSPHPHARILKIDTSKARRLPGVRAVITAEDTPKIKFGHEGLGPDFEDQLPLADEKVRYIGDEVAAVAAVDNDTAEEALGLIEVDYEELPAVFDQEEAMKPGAPLIHEGVELNIAATLKFEEGDVEKGFKEADHIFEDRFTTQAQHHCCMEPHNTVAQFDRSGNLTVWSSTQSTFFLRRGLARVFAIPLGKVRVREVKVGGGFGGKCDFDVGSEACISAFLSKKSGNPVKLELTRKEDFIATRTRHPFITDIKTGVKKDGTLTARYIKVVEDNGAYNSAGPSVIAIGYVAGSSINRITNVKYEGYCVYTNKTFGGAFRGYGNPQVTFALESQMDIIAEKLGIDPLEIRLKNAVQPGDITPCGWKITSCGVSECLQKAADGLNWKEKRRRRKAKRGVGIANMIHVSDTRAYNFNWDGSAAFIKLHDDGTASLMTGEVDMGQGTYTVLAQIAAEELGVRLEDIRVIAMDTETTPLGLGAWSSRTTLAGGNGVKIAAADAKRQLLEVAAEKLEANIEDLEARSGRIYVKGSPEKGMSIAEAVRASQYSAQRGNILGRGYYNAPNEMVDHQTGRGNISPAYPFAAQAVEVEVDIETGKVKVLKFVAAHDLGKAINPVTAEGQIEGGVHMGLGYALTEGLVHDEKGKILNPSFTDYKMLNVFDMPPVKPILVETNDPEGPFGAKGLGEPVLVPTAAAIANAIYDAVGVRIKELPITPEKLLKALKEKERLGK